MATLALSIDRRLILIGKLFSHEISLFRDYFQKVRVHINSEHLEIEAEFRRKLVDDETITEDELYQKYEVAKLRHTEDFPRILRSSHYTAIYSFFEQSLFFLCDMVHGLKKSPFRAKELQGKGINQARQYLVRVAGVKMASYSEIWEKIQFYAEVRNKIVHNGGDLVLPQDKDLISRFKKYPTFELTGRNSISLTDDSCHDSLFFYEKFLNNLIAELSDNLMPIKKPS